MIIKKVAKSTLLLLAFSGLSAPAYANDQEELIERLEDVEDYLIDIEERIGSRAIVNAFEGISLDLGGYLLTSVTHYENEDDSDTAFDKAVAAILLKAQITDNWSLFIANKFGSQSQDPLFATSSHPLQTANGAKVGYRRNDIIFEQDSVSGLDLGYAEYRTSDSFKLTMGRLVTPHGLENMAHFPGAQTDTDLPLAYRTGMGRSVPEDQANLLFPNILDGFLASGEFFTEGGSSWGYNVYFGDTQNNHASQYAGARFDSSLARDTIKIGLNVLDGDRAIRSAAPFPVIGQVDAIIDAKYTMFGADVVLDFGKVVLKAEYFETDEEEILTGATSPIDNTEAFNVQAELHFTDNWMFFLRSDRVDVPLLSTQDTDNPSSTGIDESVYFVSFGEVEEIKTGLVYKPSPSVTVRWTYTDREYIDLEKEFASTSTTPNARLADSSAQIYKFEVNMGF